MIFLPTGRDSLANNPLFLASKAGQALQKNPLGFIDVGARGGAHDIIDPIAKLTAVLGFEPDRAECERLMSIPDVYEPWAEFILEPIALADKVGQAELVLLSANTNHSLLPPNTEYTTRYNMPKWQEVGRESLETELLDTILYSGQLANKHFGEFIKLDTQGTEYEILLGAEQMLNERTVAVVTEVAFCELYKGQKLFSEIEMLLRKKGFSFYGFSRLHGRSCKLLDKSEHVTAERAFYADAIFFKDPLPGASDRCKNMSERGTIVLYTIALLLGYYDFALELANKTWAADAESEASVKQLISELAHYQPKQTHDALKDLLTEVNQSPELANIKVGSFVDKRRRACNYDDVMNASVSPRTL